MITNTFVIFIAGVSGVFIGMGMLYAAIKCISLIADRLSTRETEKND